MQVRSGHNLRWTATAFCLMIPAVVFAQPHPGPASPEHDKGWFAVGIGAGSPYGFCTMISANFGRTRIVQASVHGNSGLLGGNSVGAFSIAMGRSSVSRWARIAATVGPALVFGTNYRFTRSHYTTLGVLANLQGSLTPIKELGVGLDLYANLNLKKSAIGAGITIVLEGNK